MPESTLTIIACILASREYYKRQVRQVQLL